MESKKIVYNINLVTKGVLYIYVYQNKKVLPRILLFKLI